MSQGARSGYCLQICSNYGLQYSILTTWTLDLNEPFERLIYIPFTSCVQQIYIPLKLVVFKILKRLNSKEHKAHETKIIYSFSIKINFVFDP